MRRFLLVLGILSVLAAGLGLVTAETFFNPTQAIEITSDSSWWAYTYYYTSPPTDNWDSGSDAATIDVPIIYGDWIGFWTYDADMGQYTQGVHWLNETLYTGSETQY